MRHPGRGPQPCAVAPTAYSFETQRLTKLIATRQAVKTLVSAAGGRNPTAAGGLELRGRAPGRGAAVATPSPPPRPPELNYLSETNGEQHLFLHNYVADNPLPLAGEADADEWVARLATSPLTTVQDPRRSSVPSVAAAAAVLQGEREVSPRDVAERVLALRAHIAEEMREGLGRMGEANAGVRRRCAPGGRALRACRLRREGAAGGRTSPRVRSNGRRLTPHCWSRRPPRCP
jgi:hypothetical protein